MLRLTSLPVLATIVMFITFQPINADQRGDNPEQLTDELNKLIELMKPMSSRATDWHCEKQSGSVCDASGCKSIEPSGWLRILFQEIRPIGLYDRCDKKGCDTYPMQVETSGGFTLVSYQPGTLFKALNDGSEFVEAVTLGTAIIVYHGVCKPVSE